MRAVEGTVERTSGRASILIVDDLPEQRLVLQTVLQELELDIVLAASGRDALKAILESEFAVVLLDVNMPDIDGFETASLIRQYRRSAHTPIIFVTAFADELQTAHGYSLGAVDYILSPVVPEVLRSKVKVFVELYNLQRRIREQAEERIALAAAEAARRVAEENTRRSNYLARASHELSGSLDPDVCLQRLVDLVVPDLVPLALVVFEGVNDSGERLIVRSADRLSQIPEQLTSDMLPSRLRAGIRGARSARTPRPLAASQLRVPVGARFPWVSGLLSGLALPLWVGDHSIGALVIADRRESFDTRDITLFEELADRAAIALENARLYRSLQKEIVERQHAERELEHAGRRKDQFLAMLSHELRNPLAPIRTALDVLRRSETKDPHSRRARDIIGRQVGHLTHLVEELLDIARIGQGKIALSMETVELSEVIEQAVETARPLMESKRHQLVVNVDDTPISICGDVARLVQIISNLLNNAAKFTPEGGRIELMAGIESAELAFLSVRDNGIGIEAELLPRVFELFTQGDHTLDRSLGGLGIGLTLVRELVQLHGGSVEASSEGPGSGAEFNVLLPRARCSSAPDIRAADKYPVALALLRVLVVDDNVDAGEILALLLGSEGHEVRAVTDGEEALKVADNFCPHVILLDIGLPKLNGYQVAERLLSRPRDPAPMLIALTGYGREEEIARCAASGFHRHFVKPVDPQCIREAISQWLDLSGVAVCSPASARHAIADAFPESQ